MSFLLSPELLYITKKYMSSRSIRILHYMCNKYINSVFNYRIYCKVNNQKTHYLIIKDGLIYNSDKCKKFYVLRSTYPSCSWVRLIDSKELQIFYITYRPLIIFMWIHKFIDKTNFEKFKQRYMTIIDNKDDVYDPVFFHIFFNIYIYLYFNILAYTIMKYDKNIFEKEPHKSIKDALNLNFQITGERYIHSFRFNHGHVMIENNRCINDNGLLRKIRNLIKNSYGILILDTMHYQCTNLAINLVDINKTFTITEPSVTNYIYYSENSFNYDEILNSTKINKYYNSITV